MNHANLFSGIGGFDLASKWMGWNNIFQVEIDDFCNKILAKHFPETKRFKDIKNFDCTPYNGMIDVLTASPPCQPFSCVGKKKGKLDERNLFPDTLRIIREIKPRFIIIENVPETIHSLHEEICMQLENEDYSIGTCIIPAFGVQAPHQRKRVWYLANSNSLRTSPITTKDKQMGASDIKLSGGADMRLWERASPPVTEFCGISNGLSTKLYQNRLKVLGNTIVPQIAYLLFKGIEEFCSISLMQ
jgi:DNA-cytosine methyltransferase